MRDKLKATEQQVRKLKRRDRDQKSDMKMSKSLSVDNTMISNKLRLSMVNLGHIVNSVNEMKDSNDRSTRLIKRTSGAAKEIYYAN